jgi:hypothetical protein
MYRAMPNRIRTESRSPTEVRGSSINPSYALGERKQMLSLMVAQSSPPCFCPQGPGPRAKAVF